MDGGLKVDVPWVEKWKWPCVSDHEEGSSLPTLSLSSDSRSSMVISWNVLRSSPKWISHFTISLSKMSTKKRKKCFLSLGLGLIQLILAFQIWKTWVNFRLSVGECEFPFELLLYPKPLYKYICGDAAITMWRRKRQPTLVFLPGESHGQRSLAGYSPWGCKESDTTEWLNINNSESSSWAVKCKAVQLLSARDSLGNLPWAPDFFNLWNRLHLDPLFCLWDDNRSNIY